jgi:uncharacterized membrane protein YbhN (UPF0104 family)
MTVVGFLAIAGLALLLTPGLGEVRDRIEEANAGWLVLAVVFEFLSCVSYVLMFRPIFCPRMPWRASWEIGWSELGMGSLVPASGAGGLVLGAWILRQGGMPADHIARRSVAFFLIKSSVNFVAVAVIGTVMAVGIVGPHKSLLLTALPAGLAVLSIAAVLWLPRFGPGDGKPADAGRLARAAATVRRTLVDGIAEGVQIVRWRSWLVLIGAVGYWAWDNAVLWAAFHAFGAVPPVGVIVMAYFVGTLANTLPLPGGVGGVDGGMIGAFLAFGIDPGTAVLAVLAYRAIAFWLPTLPGAIAYFQLRRTMGEWKAEQAEAEPQPAPARIAVA